MLKFTNRTIAILTISFLTMVAWIGFQVFHVQQKKAVRPLAEKAKPFSTELKLDVIKTLELRPTFLEFAEQTPARPSPPPASPSATPPPLRPPTRLPDRQGAEGQASTPSGSPSATPTPTPSPPLLP